MADVLIVDDDLAAAERMRGSLAAAGFGVSVAHTDAEALAQLGQTGRRYEVLVADIDLGAGVTGYDVARRARQLNRGLTVIFLTGDAGALRRFGVPDAVMTPKPVDLAQLVQLARG